MPTTVFQRTSDASRFQKALNAIGGSVTAVHEVPPFLVVRYKLPKGRKAVRKRKKQIDPRADDE